MSKTLCLETKIAGSNQIICTTVINEHIKIAFEQLDRIVTTQNFSQEKLDV